MDDAKRLTRLIGAGRPCVFIGTHEEEDALNTARAAAMSLRRDAWVWSLARGLRSAIVANDAPLQGTEHPAATLHYVSTVPGEGVWVFLDVLEHAASDAHTLRALRDAIESCRGQARTIVLIDHADRPPAVIESHAERFELSYPDDEQIERIIRAVTRRMHTENNPVDARMSRADFDLMVRNMRGLNRRQIEHIVADTITEDRRLSADDLNAVLAYKRKRLHADGLLEYVESPTSLDEIGGFQRLKRWLAAREYTLVGAKEPGDPPPPRGVLLLGVQGAGKSMCAKAIATAWKRPLLRLDPGVLYDRFIGESERKLRQALRQAESMAPIVLWIDEIEKGFAGAASRSIDGGLSLRMFGTFLTWMQDHRAPVFLVATANNIDALPPEMLRKGRFDEVFFVDLPGASVRQQIWTIHLRRRGLDPASFDLDALVRATRGYSGAEIEQAVIASMHEARHAGGAVGTALMVQTAQNSPPLSVTMRERVDALRDWARGRCVPVDEACDD